MLMFNIWTFKSISQDVKKNSYMDCKFIEFSEVSSKLWDQEVDKMEGHIHLVRSNSINFYSAYDKIFNKSFLIEVEKKNCRHRCIGD